MPLLESTRRTLRRPGGEVHVAAASARPGAWTGTHWITALGRPCIARSSRRRRALQRAVAFVPQLGAAMPGPARAWPAPARTPDALWLLRRRGEYFACLATGLFIPFEVYELVHGVTPLKVGALLLNTGLVVYLAVAKRLFGLRGGKRAYEASRRAASLLETEQAAAVRPAPP